MKKIILALTCTSPLLLGASNPGILPHHLEPLMSGCYQRVPRNLPPSASIIPQDNASYALLLTQGIDGTTKQTSAHPSIYLTPEHRSITPTHRSPPPRNIKSEARDHPPFPYCPQTEYSSDFTFLERNIDSSQDIQSWIKFGEFLNGDLAEKNGLMTDSTQMEMFVLTLASIESNSTSIHGHTHVARTGALKEQMMFLNTTFSPDYAIMKNALWTATDLSTNNIRFRYIYRFLHSRAHPPIFSYSHTSARKKKVLEPKDGFQSDGSNRGSLDQ